MSDFAIDDRVEIVISNDYRYIGKVGTVTEIEPIMDGWLRVKFDEQDKSRLVNRAWLRKV